MAAKDYWKATSSIRRCAQLIDDPKLRAMVADGEVKAFVRDIGDSTATDAVRLRPFELLSRDYPDVAKRHAKWHEKSVNEAALRRADERYANRFNRPVRPGDTSQQVITTGWGYPSHINRTTTAPGVREQWVYGEGIHQRRADGDTGLTTHRGSMEILFFLSFWIVLSVVAGIIAGARGRAGFGFFLLALLLSPFIGLILAVALPSRTTVARANGEVASARTHTRCHACRELVRRDALKCKHCGEQLTPVATNATAPGDGAETLKVLLICGGIVALIGAVIFGLATR